jgi:hypothetical protein
MALFKILRVDEISQTAYHHCQTCESKGLHCIMVAQESVRDQEVRYDKRRDIERPAN